MLFEQKSVKLQRKNNLILSNFGNQKLKKKVFSWVVVFDFMVLILFQKVLWHHKMPLDSKISSQKTFWTNTLKLTQNLCYQPTKKIEKISWFPPEWPIFDNIDVAWNSLTHTTTQNILKKGSKMHNFVIFIKQLVYLGPIFTPRRWIPIFCLWEKKYWSKWVQKVHRFETEVISTSSDPRDKLSKTPFLYSLSVSVCLFFKFHFFW